MSILHHIFVFRFTLVTVVARLGKTKDKGVM